MKQAVTPDLIRAALRYIPATLARDDWARIAMAIKSEFPDGPGFDIFVEWSATSDAYDSKAAKSTWRSVKAGGGVGIGSLLHLAMAQGFKLPRGTDMPASPAPAVLAQREAERAARLRDEQLKIEADNASAAEEAAALWEQSSDAGESLYLQRKGIKPYGVRFATDDWLLVPMRNGAGQLLNVQRIAPEKPASDSPDKLFLKGGRKSGLWHLVGDVVESAVLLVAEGYATAASLHEATGYPVAVAFDAGNLAHVAKALRKLYPAALLVLCGDDDVQTFARTGNNPGRDKATAAARAVRGLAVFPEPLQADGSDFNDLHQAAGLEAVRAIVQAAIDAHQASQTAAHAAQTAKAGKTSQSTRQAPSVADADKGRAFDVFAVNDDGVWHEGVDQDGKRKPPEWICSRLNVEALTRDQDGGGWGYLLTFADPLGHAKQWAMPARMLSGDGGEYRATLLNMGLRIATTPRARNLLTQYIQTRTPDEFASCSDRIGWHGHAFVLPKETIGDGTERIVFQSDSQMENTFKVKSSAAQWRERVGKPCAGNSRLVFSLSCAFAGPLLRPAGMESGGFHLRGDSSSGKTTALKLAASVYGGANYLQRWRTTDNALEAIAAQHCDSLLILDELAQVDPKTAGECAYMLANEQSKARSTRTGMPRARLSWRLLFLSAGELGLADHMAEGMKRARTGQEVRMADIPADAGAGLGIFENLHGHEGGAAFARYLTHGAAACYGAPGHTFIEWACSHADTLSKRVREATAALAAQIVPAGASGQVERVGARFALVGVAGELATEAGLTGWEPRAAERAAKACFDAWLTSRGGMGNGEDLAMLRAVRRFLELGGEGRFTWWHRSADDHNVKTLNRAGFRRMLNQDGEPIKSNNQHLQEFGDRMPASRGDETTVEFFLMAEVFRSEVCAGFDYRAVCKVLLAHECLVPDKGRAYDCRPRLPGLGDKVTCYRISSRIFALDI